MDLRPWNYWTRDGVPYARDRRGAVARSRRCWRRTQNHPGALHLWIHLWEPTDTPERAEAEADRLLPLMPGAGHIVHMPAHIYQRVGRHADVIAANMLAAKADEDYIAQCRAQGLYPLGYYPHNLHFIWMGATASGRGQLALESAQKLANAIPHEALGSVPILQGFLVVPYWAMVRFGEWDDILADKGPRHDTPFTRGVVALRARDGAGRQGPARRAPRRSCAKLRALVADPVAQGPDDVLDQHRRRRSCGSRPEVVAGEIAAKRKDWDQRAILHLDRAVRYEDALIYQEPADWHAPVRQNLGGGAAARPAAPDEAEAVYWEDLKKNPENGWSLFGLTQALKAQGKTAGGRGVGGAVQEGVEGRGRHADRHARRQRAPTSQSAGESEQF